MDETRLKENSSSVDKVPERAGDMQHYIENMIHNIIIIIISSSSSMQQQHPGIIVKSSVDSTGRLKMQDVKMME